jgi:hypothetical protein
MRHQDVLFAVVPGEDAGQGELLIKRLLWLPDDDEPEVLALSLEIESPRGEQVHEVTIVGSPPYASTEEGPPALNWQEFCEAIPREIAKCADLGYVLTGKPIGWDG